MSKYITHKETKLNYITDDDDDDNDDDNNNDKLHLTETGCRG
jgi:hypothetical protein